VCLAGALYKGGFLKGLEPLTGSGSERHDLVVGVNDRTYDIEVKAFTSAQPGHRLRQELRRKVSTLPKIPARPVVFYAMLVEQGVFEKAKQERFCKDLAELGQSLPEQVGAIVAGRMFVDSQGGRVKRDVMSSIINPRALTEVAGEDLDMMFTKNYSYVTYPIFGITSFMSFGLGTTTEAGGSA
jgi:hypothetical protein